MSSAIVKELAAALPANQQVIDKVGGVYHWVLSQPSGAAKHITIDLKNKPGLVEEKEATGKVDCTISASEADFVSLFQGKGNPQQLFMQGKLKIKGNMSYAMKLSELLKLKKAGGGAAAAAASASTLECAPVFEMMKNELPNHPDVVKRVQAVYQYIVTKDGKEAGAYVVDLKNGAGSVTAGKADKADCTVTISDSDFIALFSGKANPQQMFMQGKLKFKGSMAYAMKLSELMKLKPQAKL